MSDYPYWLLSFDLRPDLETHVLAALEAVARGESPQPAELARLPRVPRSYLGSGHLQSDQGSTLAGTPVRIAHSWSPDVLTLTIEFAQHDDEFANDGWIFWLWVLSLARRPQPGSGRALVIGLHGAQRGDATSQLVRLDAEGVTEDGIRVPWSEIEEILAAEDAGEVAQPDPGLQR